MVHWSASYEYGKAQEEKVIPALAEHFHRAIIATEGRFAKYDCYDNDNDYEIKSRTVPIDKYPTTMITCNKFQDAKRALLLVFNFTDCLAYIKYDAEAFSAYTKKSFSRAGCCWDEKEHIYIPKEHLTVIRKW